MQTLNHCWLLICTLKIPSSVVFSKMARGKLCLGIVIWLTLELYPSSHNCPHPTGQRSLCGLNKHSGTHIHNMDTAHHLCLFHLGLFFKTQFTTHNLVGAGRYSRFQPWCSFFFSNISCFLYLVGCGDESGGTELWSGALLESVIILSGQSVWNSAVAFQSPPPAPPVRHSSLPP